MTFKFFIAKSCVT